MIATRTVAVSDPPADAVNTVASPSWLTRSRIDWAFAVTAIVLCSIALYIGLAQVRLFGHDVFFLLDNGYRVLSGQVPHRDFSTAWGPVIYLIEAAGLFASGMQPSGVGYANALFGLLIGVWLYFVSRSRLLPLAAFAAAICAFLIVIAPYPLGNAPLAFSYAMVYNRYGYALLAVVVVECLTDHERQPHGQLFRGGASSGVAIGLLFFLKITYCVVAVPILALSVLYGGARRVRVWGLAAGVTAVVLAILSYLRFDVTDMLFDLVSAATGRGSRWQPSQMIAFSFGDLTQTFPLGFLAFALFDARRAAGMSIRRVRAFFVVITALSICGLLASTNCQTGAITGTAFVAIVLASEFVRLEDRERGENQRSATVSYIAIGLTCIALAAIVVPSVISLVGAASANGSVTADAVPIHAKNSEHLIFAPWQLETETSGPMYAAIVNDGLALLQRHTTDADGVLAIDMINPFNYLLGRPSPKGGIAAAAYNYTFSGRMPPSNDRLFGNTRYVIVRKYIVALDDYYIKGYRETYNPFLETKFDKLEETAHWVLWRKR
jgi:hypothetical protein